MRLICCVQFDLSKLVLVKMFCTFLSILSILSSSVVTLPARVPDDRIDIQEFMAAVEEALTSIVETGEYQGNYTEPEAEVEAVLQEIFSEDQRATAVRDSEPKEEDENHEVSIALEETQASIISSAVAFFTAFWTSEVSPVQQLLSVVDSYTQYFFGFFLPAKSRAGRVIVPVISVAVTLLVILLALFPILYITAYLLGKFVLAPLVLAPFQSRVKVGRSLDDPDLLNSLTEGVITALDTYNMLQDLNSLRSW